MSETKKKSGPWVDFQIVTIFFMMLTLMFLMMGPVITMPIMNKATGQPYSCIVESVELKTSRGGPRTSTSHSTVIAYTSNCGDIYINRLIDTDVGSYEELAQKLEERKGQAVVFYIGRVQVSSDALRAERVEF